MEIELTANERRVLGCMIEKSITTPENYPLSLNSLVNACNQKSNRYPVMDLDEDEVLEALDELRNQHLCFRVDVSGSRVPKFKYNLPEKWEFTGKHLAIVCELLVRGPQTPGELRSRGDRMYSWLDLDEVESTLEWLSAHEEGPFVQKLPVQPGKKEARFAELLGGEINLEEYAEASPETVMASGPSRNERVDQLEAEVARLSAEVEG
ncbi:MAG: DUF480 domain-containing protein, partial [Verrucomicrobiae bacterium]|nr:DUF480 domain-containing protein [Verrucomicrobiae bacterium]